MTNRNQLIGGMRSILRRTVLAAVALVLADLGLSAATSKPPPPRYAEFGPAIRPELVEALRSWQVPEGRMVVRVRAPQLLPGALRQRAMIAPRSL